MLPQFFFFKVVFFNYWVVPELLKVVGKVAPPLDFCGIKLVVLYISIIYVAETALKTI